MHDYEIALIVRPEVEEESREAIIGQLSQILSAEGGAVANVERWGRRQLAYPIRKATEGYYYFIQGKFASSVLPEVTRNIRLSEAILRHMIVRADE